MAFVPEFDPRPSSTIRDDALRTLARGLKRRGVPNPQVGPGSDDYVRFQAFANEAEIAEANATVRADQLMPDTATGADLERGCAKYKITRRPAGPSAGVVVLDVSADSLVATGAELKDTSGQRYKVSIGGIYSDGAYVPIVSIATGAATNLQEGDVLQWISAPPYASSSVTVGPGGLINGTDAEDDETLRARLYEHLRAPPASGNPQHVAEIAEDKEGNSLPEVQKAFVYPAVQGPSTTHVAVVAAPTATNKNRSVADATMNGKVRPFVLGQLPPGIEYTVTTVTNQAVDIALALTLPVSPVASPPGEGGGWIDGTPWPIQGSLSAHAEITAVASSTSFTVDASTPPTIGVSHISWLSPYDWTLYSAVVTGYSGVGPYHVTVDAPFPGLTVGCYVWPSCERAQVYVDAVLAFFKLMGPGEKTSNASALVRGFRHPRPSASWPYAVGKQLASALKGAASEIADAQFVTRKSGLSSLLGNSGEMTPTVPATVTDPPSIFVPQHLAFYRLIT